MLADEQIEELIMLVGAMDRPTLIQHFNAYRASFPVDFNSTFLNNAPLDQLRHIFVGMCIQTRRMPDRLAA